MTHSCFIHLLQSHCCTQVWFTRGNKMYVTFQLLLLSQIWFHIWNLHEILHEIDVFLKYIAWKLSKVKCQDQPWEHPMRKYKELCYHKKKLQNEKNWAERNVRTNSLLNEISRYHMDSTCWIESVCHSRLLLSPQVHCSCWPSKGQYPRWPEV